MWLCPLPGGAVRSAWVPGLPGPTRDPAPGAEYRNELPGPGTPHTAIEQMEWRREVEASRRCGRTILAGDRHLH